MNGMVAEYWNHHFETVLQLANLINSLAAYQLKLSSYSVTYFDR